MYFQVFCSHKRTDELLADYCDGSFVKLHPLFQSDVDALQIILYFDEVEVCDPLASHAGVNKLGMNRSIILNSDRTIMYLRFNRTLLLHAW